MNINQIFTPDELAGFQRELKPFRPEGAYVPGKWMVNPLNRSVGTAAGKFPKRVVLRDITLRTLEQMPGMAQTQAERRELMLALAAAGVPEISTSSFRRGHTLEEMTEEVKLVKQVAPACQLVYGSVANRAEMEMAAASGYDSVQVWHATYLGRAIPISAGATYSRAWQGRNWRELRFPNTLAEHLERPQRVIRMGADLGVKVSAWINILSLTTEEYVDTYCRMAYDNGAFEVALADSSGGSAPEAIARLVEVAKTAAPKLQIALHTHNMYGLGIATSIAGARAGAEVIEVAVNGLDTGPAGCQASLAGTAAALEVLYGVDTGIDLGQLEKISAVAERITRMPRTWNEPVLGSGAHECALVDDMEIEAITDPLIHGSLVSSVVGVKRKFPITAATGPWTAWWKFESLGIRVTQEQVLPLLAECRRAMAGGGTLEDDDIRAIAVRWMDANSPK